MSKCYIFGPMSGLPDNNYPAFFAEEEVLKRKHKGINIFNPAANPIPEPETWVNYMRIALTQLVQCDRIHGLSGWSSSRGAKIEYKLAKDLGLEITFQNEQAASEEFNVK